MFQYIKEENKKGSMLPLSLTFDHRVLDGVPAAAFYAQLNVI